MARLATYSQDTSISVDDLLIGTDAEDSNITKNYKIGDLKDFIAGSELVTAKVTLTPARILSLNGGGSIELIAAPGANKVIAPVSIVIFLDYNTTAYNFSGIPSISGTGSISSAFLNSSSDKYWNLLLGGNYLEVNSALAMFATSLSVTQGDSPLKFNILYRIVDFS